VGDGFVGTKPDRELLEVFRGAGGAGKRTFGHLKVCWAASEREAKATTREWWPNAALGGELKTDLATPAQFESALELAREEDVVGHIVCGPDADRHVRAIRAYEEAGYDAVYVHQIGPDQEGFLRFYEREVMGRVART
jgi:G6PDH family F420-dependent oxidoreductase